MSKDWRVCNGCGKTLASSKTLWQHKKTCPSKSKVDLLQQTMDDDEVPHATSKRMYVPPSFINSVINQDSDENETLPSKKKKIEIISSPIKEIPSPSIKPLQIMDADDGHDDDDDDDESAESGQSEGSDEESEDTGDEDEKIEVEDLVPPQQLRDRLVSLVNLYLNDKHYELYDEIVRLTDKLYKLKEFTQHKRRTIYDLIDKVPLEDAGLTVGANRNEIVADIQNIEDPKIRDLVQRFNRLFILFWKNREYQHREKLVAILEDLVGLEWINQEEYNKINGVLCSR